MRYRALFALVGVLVLVAGACGALVFNPLQTPHSITNVFLVLVLIGLGMVGVSIVLPGCGGHDEPRKE